MERSWVDAADAVVGQAQLSEPGWQSTGHRGQPVPVGEEVPQLGLVLQAGPLQLVALQLVVIYDEPAETRDVGQDGGGQGRDVVTLETAETNTRFPRNLFCS